MQVEFRQRLTEPFKDKESGQAMGNAGGLLTYLAAVFSNIAQELRQSPAEDCALCSDPILSTHVAAEESGRSVHAVCLEMHNRKQTLLESAREQSHDCSLCGEKVQPMGIYFHEAGLTLSYSCNEPGHEEPNVFSLPILTEESRRVGTWEARLRERLKEKGYVRCCECGRLLRAEAAKLLGQGWYYCGCLPDLWRTGP
jgi:hypothetical protein